jgi:hypothetical protein
MAVQTEILPILGEMTLHRTVLHPRILKNIPEDDTMSLK